MTIVQKYNTTNFDEVNFELEALRNFIVTAQENYNKSVLALPSPESFQAIVNDFNGKFVAAVQNAEQGQKGVETRMGDLERSHNAIKTQIADTAEALKEAPQDKLQEVIDILAESASVTPP